MCREGTTELESRKRELKDIIEDGNKPRDFRDYLLQLRNLILISRQKQVKKHIKQFTLAGKIMWMIGMHWLKLMKVVCRGRCHLEMIQTGQKFLESRILEFWNKRKVNAFKTKQDYHFILGDHKNWGTVRCYCHYGRWRSTTYSNELYRDSQINTTQDILFDKIKVNCSQNCRYDRSQQ